MKTLICIPTYNEASNIEPLVSEILKLRQTDLDVLIIDDNSPDKTGRIADRLAQQYENISVLHRAEKHGLGPAYVAGFTYALEKDYGLIMQMDADFSHDPKEIPALVAAAENYDLVLGSRYIEGGGIENWSLLRRLVSYFGNMYARIVLFSPVHDMTGGFKCYRRLVLESIDIHGLSSLGYVFQIETTYRALRKGARVKEIPITFTERREGESKFNVAIFVGAFFKVLMLRFKKG